MNEQISLLLEQLIQYYDGFRKIKLDEVNEALAFCEREKDTFSEEEMDLYKRMLDAKEAYEIRQTMGEEVSHVRLFSKLPAKKIVLGTVAVTTVAGASYGIYQTLHKESSLSKDANTNKSMNEDVVTDNTQTEKVEGTKSSNLTEEKIRERYAESADIAAKIIESARTNGVALEADEVSHLMLIANIRDLTNDQKYELASARHPITLHDWRNFSDKIFTDCVDVTPDTIPFDANLLFGNTESAKDVNHIMQIFAKWNTTHDASLKQELRDFLSTYAEEESFQKKLSENPAAVEFVLNVASLSSDASVGLLPHDEFEANLFSNEGCRLAQARMALGADLQFDQTLIKDETIQITDASMSDTATLQSNSFLSKYDDNKILQIKFVANQMDLTSIQEQDLANKLDLAQTMNTWRTFGEDYANAISTGVSFDANALFLGDGKAAAELNKAQAIFQEYIKESLSLDENRKLELYNEWNELYYRNFVNVQEGILETNKPAAYLLSQLLQKANSYGLTLEKADSVYAQDQNGTIHLYDVIVGNGLTDEFCNSMKNVTIDEFGNEVSHRTFWEETYSDMASSLRSVSITSDKNISKTTMSLYEQIVSEGRATTEIEEKLGLNRHDIFVSMIEEKVKDIALQNVTNPEDVIQSRDSMGMGATIGGYTIGSGSPLGDIVIDESSVIVNGEGSTERDSNLELWTEEDVKKAEEEASKDKNETIGNVFEDVEDKVVSEDKKEEDVFTDKDKQDNEDAANRGDITDQEKEDMNKNHETIKNEDENGNDVHWTYENDLSEEDINILIKISEEFDRAEEDYKNGKISEEDFQKAVEKFDNATNAIFAKYQTDNGKVDTPVIDNTNNNNNSNKGDEIEKPNTTEEVRKAIIEKYKIDVNDYFEYEGTKLYYSETEGCYIDLSTFILPNTTYETVEEVKPEVVEEKVIFEEEVNPSTPDKKEEPVYTENGSLPPVTFQPTYDSAVSVDEEEVLGEAESIAYAEPAQEETLQNEVSETPAQEEAIVEEEAQQEEIIAPASETPVQEVQQEEVPVQAEVSVQEEAPAIAEPAPVSDTSAQIQELEDLKEQLTAPEVTEEQSLSL